MRRERRRGFTLVELLVVIAIIGILMAVLVPALSKARQASYSIKCASNLRSIGQGILMYVAENKATFPASYIYAGQKVEGQIQTPDTAVNGYIHWTSYLFKRTGGTVPLEDYKRLKGWDMFSCPALPGGGHPPTNTFAGNWESGQKHINEAVIDQQAPRNAYTANEALMPRNKWVNGFQGGTRHYQYVRFSSVKKANQVILATEYMWDARLISEAADATGEVEFKTHRPVHAFVGSGAADGQLDVSLIPSGGGIGRNGPLAGFNIMQVKTDAADHHRSPLVNPLVKFGDRVNSRLEWVGRNHGRGATAKTNFVYVDGHVETKTIEETLYPKFEWGATFYSLAPNGDVEPTTD